MHTETINKLRTLLAETEALVQTDINAAHDYQSLKLQIVEKELVDEVKHLTMLLESNPDFFPEAFKERCKLRAARNAGTCLSFMAMPLGDCNELYWHIAELVFEPQTMGEMLGLLLPEVKTQLVCDLYLNLPARASFQEIKEANKDPAIRFLKTSITNLKETPSIDALTHFVVADNLLFDLNSIVSFTFKMHQTFYESLHQNYSKMAEQLYKNNSDLKALHCHLLLLSGQGLSLYEVINRFAQELRLGGEKMTGNQNASLNAQRAYMEFLAYLKELPTSVRDALLLLQSNDGKKKTFWGVLTHLKDGNCIEIAAKDLQSILGNQANQSCLATRPYVSHEQVIAIKQHYGKRYQLSVKGYDPTITLPAHFLETHLKRITINDSYAYVSLLLSFPPDCYSLLLGHAKIKCYPVLPKLLAEMLQNGVLNAEQVTAFNKAIVDNACRLGGIGDILIFAARSNNHELINLSLNSLPPEERLMTVTETDDDDNPKLWRAVWENPRVLPVILTLLSKDDRHIAVQKEGCAVYKISTVLQCVVSKNPEALPEILKLLPKSKRMTAVTQINHQGRTLVYEVVKFNPLALTTILKLIPKKDRRTAINTVLHRLVTTPNVLLAGLKLLPKTERLEAVNKINSFGEIVLNQVVDINPEAIPQILKLLPKSERLLAINKQNEMGKTALTMIVEKKPEILSVILALLSEHECLFAVNKANKLGHDILREAEKKDLQSLLTILGLLPKSERLNSLRKTGNSIIYKIVKKSEDLHALLALLPNEDHSTVIAIANLHNLRFFDRKRNDTKSEISSGQLEEDFGLEIAQNIIKNDCHLLYQKHQHYCEFLKSAINELESIRPKDIIHFLSDRNVGNGRIQKELLTILLSKPGCYQACYYLDEFKQSALSHAALLPDKRCFMLIKDVLLEKNELLLHKLLTKEDRYGKKPIDYLQEIPVKNIIKTIKGSDTLFDIVNDGDVDSLAAAINTLGDKAEDACLQSRSCHGNGILHAVAESGSVECLKLIIRTMGKNIDKLYYKNSRNMTPAYYAATYGSLELLQIMLSLSPMAAEEELFNTNGTPSELVDRAITTNDIGKIEFILGLLKNDMDKIEQWYAENPKGIGFILSGTYSAAHFFLLKERIAFDQDSLFMKKFRTDDAIPFSVYCTINFHFRELNLSQEMTL